METAYEVLLTEDSFMDMMEAATYLMKIVLDAYDDSWAGIVDRSSRNHTDKNCRYGS